MAIKYDFCNQEFQFQFMKRQTKNKDANYNKKITKQAPLLHYIIRLVFYFLNYDLNTLII